MARPIVVGIDVRYLKTAETGTKTYLEELIREFDKNSDSGIVFKYLDSDVAPRVATGRIFKVIEHIRYQFWKQVALPIKAYRNNCDIVFCTDECVPYLQLGYRTIPVIHDAFCFEEPENYGKIWLWVYKNIAIPAARRSPVVITPSNWSKKQIAKFARINENKLKVVYEGPKTVTNNNNIRDHNQVLDHFDLAPADYLLHVGSPFKRKNLPRLIESFAGLAVSFPKLKLALAGPLPTDQLDSDLNIIKSIVELYGLQNKVVFTGFISSADLEVLYKHALLYVFPSINEGFGIPLLEAFKHHLPATVADNTCLPEIGGSAVLTFDPYCATDIANKITQVLTDEQLRQEMIRLGDDRLKSFSWEKAAFELIEIFKQTAKIKPR